jgi:SAM-dependent methyltransferase
VGWLGDFALDYRTEEYRLLVDHASSSEAFRLLHDPEQLDRLPLLEPVMPLRGRTVADIGCGAGTFLDLVRGHAAVTIGVEPARQYRDALVDAGHHYFPGCSEAAAVWDGRVDLAVCFSVIEHVDDPLDLLASIRRLLAPGGRALVSTPNRADWLLELLPVEYGAFFFRAVHRWYFDRSSLAAVARHAGFDVIEPFHVHRFDLSNFLVWLRDRAPSGLRRVPVDPVLDAAFRQTLVATGRSDYLYAWLGVTASADALR